IKSAIESARNARDPGQQQQMLGIVAQDVQRLDRLVTDMARASRIEAETARTDLHAVDLGALLYELVRAYAPPPDQPSAVDIVFKGPRPENAVVMGQEGPLGQVFRNLIDNAKSFSPPGGTVTVSAEVLRGKEGATLRAV